jgi:hypothetical protein
MPPFRKYKMKALRISYEDQMKWGPGMLELHLEKIMRQPELLAQAIRHAMLETLIPKLRQAWITGLTKAVNMQVVTDAAPDSHTTGMERIISNPRADPTEEGQALGRIYERLRAAQMRGDSATHQKVMQDFIKHQDGYINSLQTLASGKQKHSHYLSSGLFRQRSVEVMHAFLQDPQITQTSEGLNIGIGDLGDLEGIKTPSATEYVLHRGRTGSKFDVLWRHLEFGTGVFSQVQRANSKWNDGFTGGEWYYGQHRARARLVLKGSEGVHSLKALGGSSAHPDFVTAVEKYMTKVLTPGFLK